MTTKVRDTLVAVGTLLVWVIWFAFNLSQTKSAIEAGRLAPPVAPEEQIAHWIGAAVAPTLVVGILFIVYLKKRRQRAKLEVAEEEEMADDDPNPRI